MPPLLCHYILVLPGPCLPLYCGHPLCVLPAPHSPRNPRAFVFLIISFRKNPCPLHPSLGALLSEAPPTPRPRTTCDSHLLHPPSWRSPSRDLWILGSAIFIIYPFPLNHKCHDRRSPNSLHPKVLESRADGFGRGPRICQALC